MTELDFTGKFSEMKKKPPSTYDLSGVKKMMENMPSNQIKKLVQNDPLLNCSISKNLSTLSQLPQMKRIITSQRLFDVSTSPLMNTMKQINEQMAALRNSLNVASEVHSLKRALSLSNSLSEVVQQYQTPMKLVPNWDDNLSLKILRLGEVTDFSHLSAQSLLGFTRLTRLSITAKSISPFEEPVNELVQEEFGDVVSYNEDIVSNEIKDEIALNLGFNQDLIAFSEQDYSDVVLTAGFNLSFSEPPLPIVIEGGAESLHYDCKYNKLITYLEQHLRCFIRNKLSELEGPDWINKRVPGNLRQDWFEKQNKSREQKKVVFELIQYSYLMELNSIIVSKNNWNDVFQQYFINKNCFQTSMERLNSIRNPISHSQPISKSETIMLFNEATRILSSIGFRILN